MKIQRVAQSAWEIETTSTNENIIRKKVNVENGDDSDVDEEEVKRGCVERKDIKWKKPRE